MMLYLTAEQYAEIAADITQMFDEAGAWCKAHCTGSYTIDRTLSVDDGVQIADAKDRAAYARWVADTIDQDGAA